MAVLSALLKTLQTEEGGGDAPAVMVSPQQSEFSCIGAASAAGQGVPSMVAGLPPPQSVHVAAREEAEGLSDPLDPLDISALLPEGSSNGSAAPHVAVAAPGPPKDGLASGSGLQTLAASGSSRDSTATREGELGSFTIQAVRQQGAAAGGQAAVGVQSSVTSSRRGSRIPAPPSPAAGAKKGGSPRGRTPASSNGSPSKLSKLLTPCSWIGKHATLSSAAEAGQPGTI